ncbi:MAG: AmmeMemoRadiSam system protein A [Phycisphaeraceae bacterium]|nr:AmmeMemoRadiSam system protein A [Phycisphaeraceae bacterium]
MAPTSSRDESTSTLTPEHGRTLLRVARDSIAHGLMHHRPLEVEPAKYDSPLQPPRATFVTLHLAGELRGCIGALRATMPLVADVALHAYGAAFEDPRFEPLTGGEFDGLHLHISILAPPTPLSVADEAELLRALRPGIDGLILEDAGHRATFLPAVWESLPDPRDFVDQLKRKAGWPSGYWSPAIRVARYTCQDVQDPPGQG